MPPPPSLNGAHAARNKRKLGDHRPPGQKKSVSPFAPLPIPTRAIHGPNEEGERAKEEEVGFIMARQETNLSQLQCWPAVLQGRQAAGRKEEANAVSPIVVPMRHEASKQAAGRVARGGRGRVLLN